MSNIRKPDPVVMTVADLIKELRDHDPDNLVLIKKSQTNKYKTLTRPYELLVKPERMTPRNFLFEHTTVPSVNAELATILHASHD